MPPTTGSVEVNRPAEDVYAYATDPARFSEWQKDVLDGHLDEVGTPRVGTKCVTTRRIGFANRKVTSEVTHVNPPRTWGVRGIDGPIRATVDVTVDPVTDERSRLTIAIEFEGYGIGTLLVPLVVRPGARKEIPASLATLKQRLERETAG